MISILKAIVFDFFTIFIIIFVLFWNLLIISYDDIVSFIISFFEMRSTAAVMSDETN